MGDTGTEQDAESKGNSSVSETEGAKSGALLRSDPRKTTSDPSERLLSKLRTLNDDQRRALEALLNAIG